MEINRIKQILSSPNDIKVLYKGTSVWIDQLNEDGVTATVHLKDLKKEHQCLLRS